MDTGKTAESVIEHARWTKASAVHQDRIGKCTFLGTERLVDKVCKLLPFEEDSYALDNGCGSGSITVRISNARP